MGLENKAPVKALVDIQWDETSGVDHPANLFEGYLMMKSANGATLGSGSAADLETLARLVKAAKDTDRDGDDDGDEGMGGEHDHMQCSADCLGNLHKALEQAMLHGHLDGAPEPVRNASIAMLPHMRKWANTDKARRPKTDDQPGDQDDDPRAGNQGPDVDQDDEETDWNAGVKARKSSDGNLTPPAPGRSNAKGDGWEQEDKPILPTSKSGLIRFLQKALRALTKDGAYNDDRDSESVAEREMDWERGITKQPAAKALTNQTGGWGEYKLSGLDEGNDLEDVAQREMSWARGLTGIDKGPSVAWTVRGVQKAIMDNWPTFLHKVDLITRAEAEPVLKQAMVAAAVAELKADFYKSMTQTSEKGSDTDDDAGHQNAEYRKDGGAWGMQPDREARAIDNRVQKRGGKPTDDNPDPDGDGDDDRPGSRNNPDRDEDERQGMYESRGGTPMRRGMYMNKGEEKGHARSNAKGDGWEQEDRPFDSDEKDESDYTRTEKSRHPLAGVRRMGVSR